jgi:hypothetical protein
MNFLPLIEAKREGNILAAEQIQAFIREFTGGKIPDYQMAAMLILDVKFGCAAFMQTKADAHKLAQPLRRGRGSNSSSRASAWPSPACSATFLLPLRSQPKRRWPGCNRHGGCPNGV